MRNLLSTLLIITFAFTARSQVNQMISDSAYFVMEVDLGKIIKSVPLKDINQLEVIQPILKELEIESNTDLSKIGIDFSSKLFLYNVKNDFHESVSVVIPLDKTDRFILQLPEESQTSLKENGRFMNDNIIVSANESACILTFVKFGFGVFHDKTIALFNEKEWELPDNHYYYHFYENDEADYYDDGYEEEYYEEYEIIEVEDSEESNSTTEEIEEVYPPEEDIISEEEELQHKLEKKFRRIKDSIAEVEKSNIHNHYFNIINLKSKNLYAQNEAFRNFSQKPADAKIYMDPAMNLEIYKSYMFSPVQDLIYDEVKEMQQFATLNFTKDGIQVDWKVNYSDNFGEITEAGTSNGVDEDLLKYISPDAQGVAVYNLNTFASYEKFKDIYMPKLDASEDGQLLIASAIWSTIDEFINLEALSSIYPPKVLATYSGFKEVELSKVTYQYDEETFEYTEVDTTFMQHVPIVSFILNNKHAYLVEKYLKAFGHMENEHVIKNDHYYTIKNGPFDLGIPYHIAIKGETLIISNDEDIVKNNMDGYKNNNLDRDINNKIKNANMFYAHMDFNNIYNDIIDMGMVGNTDKFIKLFGNKTGVMELELSSIEKNQIQYSLNIDTNKKYKNGAYFLFEMINSIYLYDK